MRATSTAGAATGRRRGCALGRGGGVLDGFRDHADEGLTTTDLRRFQRVDAVVGLGELSIELARELARLEPFGLGNPGSTCCCRRRS